MGFASAKDPILSATKLVKGCIDEEPTIKICSLEKAEFDKTKAEIIINILLYCC